MKYIKTYEKYDKPENEYWKINTNNPWFEISLSKIGMTDDEIEELLNDVGISNFYLNNEYIFVELDWHNSGTIGSKYYWTEDEEDLLHEFKIKKPIYRGDPKNEITKEDIEKWKLKNDVKKFNL